MAWPQPTDYHEAIQNPRLCFADFDLRAGQAVENELGLPRPYSGNFADVYQVRVPGGKSWAVKCFTREAAHLQARYQAISDHLRLRSPPFMVRFDFLTQGIRIRGQWYPVLKMDWVEGLTLNEFVRQQINKPATLYRLAKKWVKLSLQLRHAEMAHGDLQHGNVLLVPGDNPAQLSLKLIDYDGMHLPALTRGLPGELGHPNYQHPERARESLYNPEIDRFPHLVIYTALRCLTVGGSDLLDKYDNGENLLFRERDFLEPARSELLADLWQLPDPDVRRLLGHLLVGGHLPANRVATLDDVVGAEGRPLNLTAAQEHLLYSLLPPQVGRAHSFAPRISRVSLEQLAAETADETVRLGDTPVAALAVAEARAPVRVAGAPAFRPLQKPVALAGSGKPVSMPMGILQRLWSRAGEGDLFMPGLTLHCQHCKQPKHLFQSHCQTCHGADGRLMGLTIAMAVLGGLVAALALPRNQPGVAGLAGPLAVLGILVALPVACSLAVRLALGYRALHPDVPAGPRWPAVRQVCPACGSDNIFVLFICRQCGCLRWERLAPAAALALLLGTLAAISEPRLQVPGWWYFLVELVRWPLRIGAAVSSLMLMIGCLEAWKIQIRMPRKQRLRSTLGRVALGLATLSSLIGYGLLMASFLSWGAR